MCNIRFTNSNKFLFEWRPAVARALIIEDSPSDVQKALAVLRRLGMEEPDVFARVDLALVHFQDVLDGARPAPDLLVLDLGFECESGFEVLRFLRTNKAFPLMRIVVWTRMGELQKELCGFFGAEFVSKSAGLGEFERIIRAAA